jgi:ketosteroid isomerase-like protein
MTPTRIAPAFIYVALLGACSATPPRAEAPADREALRQQVFATERAFARTMANRDHAAFTTFLSDEAIFITRAGPQRGKAQVAAGWKRFFESKEAPFNWEPEKVEVLDSGTLALSTGPVFDPAGKRAATFTSVWRLEAPATWRIVLDKGDDFCDCSRP